MASTLPWSSALTWLDGATLISVMSAILTPR